MPDGICFMEEGGDSNEAGQTVCSNPYVQPRHKDRFVAKPGKASLDVILLILL